MRQLALIVFSLVVAVVFATVPRSAQAHYTPGAKHEHIPHLGCKTIWYKDRNKPWVVELRAQLVAQGYRLYFDGHCWLRPGHKHRVIPC